MESPPSTLPTPVAPQQPTADERTMALLCHIGPMLIGFIAPLVIMLTKGNESAFVRKHAVESLNFSLTLMGALILSGLLIFVFIGCLLLPAVAIAGLVFHVLAAVKANAGQEYRYPVNVRLVS